MAKNSAWIDDYWLMLMQIYMKKPVGVKPLYHHDMVELSLELHIAPEALHDRMLQIARLDSPRIERLWQTYSDNPRRLKRAVSLLRQMKGFGAADEFYKGVDVEETFEKDFRPLAEDARMMPIMLILAIDLYFQLTPSTMKADTPEVIELAKLLKLTATDIVSLLENFQQCDPYLKNKKSMPSPLLKPCQQIWQRFGNMDPLFISQYANELKAYFQK